MIIAMIAVRVMKMPIDQVVHVIAMRYRFVAASGSMHMARTVSAATVLGRAPVGIGRRDFDHMFIDVIAMHMMQVPVVQVVDVAIVADGRMPAIGAVNM